MKTTGLAFFGARSLPTFTNNCREYALAARRSSFTPSELVRVCVRLRLSSSSCLAPFDTRTRSDALPANLCARRTQLFIISAWPASQRAARMSPSRPQTIFTNPLSPVAASPFRRSLSNGGEFGSKCRQFRELISLGGFESWMSVRTLSLSLSKQTRTISLSILKTS